MNGEDEKPVNAGWMLIHGSVFLLSAGGFAISMYWCWSALSHGNYFYFAFSLLFGGLLSGYSMKLSIRALALEIRGTAKDDDPDRHWPFVVGFFVLICVVAPFLMNRCDPEGAQRYMKDRDDMREQGVP